MLSKDLVNTFVELQSLKRLILFIKTPFVDKGMDFIDLPSIFQDKSVTSSIPD